MRARERKSEVKKKRSKAGVTEAQRRPAITRKIAKHGLPLTNLFPLK